MASRRTSDFSRWATASLSETGSRRTPSSSSSSGMIRGVVGELGRQLHALLEPRQSRRDQRTDRQIRVRAQVERLDLAVRRRVARAHDAGHEPDRGLAVLAAPHLIHAGPVRRHQPEVARHRRRADGEQRGQLGQDARDERLRLGRHAVGTVADREEVLAVPPRAEVHVAPVAHLAGDDHRRERRLPVVPGATPRMVWRASTIRSAASTGLRWRARFQLARGVLRVELVDADPLLLESVHQIGDEVGELGEHDRAVGGAAMRRHQPAVFLLPAGEPLDLTSHREVEPLRRGPVDHAPEERALTYRRHLALLREPVGRPPRPARLGGEDPDGVGVHHRGGGRPWARPPRRSP